MPAESAGMGEKTSPSGQQARATMCFASPRIVAAALAAAILISASDQTLAQSADAKAGTQRQQSVDGDGQKKVDEFAEAAKLLGGPAANPECVWLGRRVVGLLWRDDLDTAFRHLDLYDRFGCPAAHIQTAFRCLLRQGKPPIEPLEKVNDRAHACWISPNSETPAPLPSAAVPSGTTNR